MKIVKILLWALAAITVAVFATSPLWLPTESYTHSGKMLASEEDYRSFKQMMASSDISSFSTEILNTDYPIVIQYEFNSQSSAMQLAGEYPVQRNRNEDCLFGVFFSIVFVLPMLWIQ